MTAVLRFASIAEANTALKTLKKAKGGKALKKALSGIEKRHGKPAKAVKARARSQVRTATTPPAETLLHPADVKRVRKMARQAVRAAVRETSTPEPTTTAPPMSDLAGLTGEDLWNRRGKVLTAFAATSGPAAPFWSAYENGEPLAMPLSTFTGGRGPTPYGGDGPAAA